jgi:iron-sulfur cluster assembly protein
MNITPNAWKHIEEIVNDKCLRVGIRGGGCSGLSYVFQLDTPRTRDLIFELNNIKVLVDPKSNVYLKDVTLDYEETLMRQGFNIINPRATKSCGCGSSFSIG